MTLEHVLRTLAIAIAIIGVIDPPWTRPQRAPVPVLLEMSENDSEAAAVRRALESRLGNLVTFDSPNEPAAIVLAGAPRVASRAGRGDVPVSVVMRRPTDVPNVRVVEASDPAGEVVPAIVHAFVGGAEAHRPLGGDEGADAVVAARVGAHDGDAAHHV